MPEAEVREVDQALQAGLLELGVDKGQLGRERGVEDHPSDGGLEMKALHQLGLGVENVLLVSLDRHVDEVAGKDHLDRLERVNSPIRMSEQNLFQAREDPTALVNTQCILGSQIVNPQHHVLGRHGERSPRGRGEDVAGSQHENPRLELRHW